MIETNRLLISALNYNELKLYSESISEFAKLKLLSKTPSGLDEETKQAITNDLLPFLANQPEFAEFYTIWVAIDKQSNCLVSSFCFHGQADDNNEVEIGYGTQIEFLGFGYMSETVAGIIDWCRNNRNIKSIKAETESDNYASIRVLQKNNFIQTGTNDSKLVFQFFLF